jgi:hypothetical protein
MRRCSHRPSRAVDRSPANGHSRHWFARSNVRYSTIATPHEGSRPVTSDHLSAQSGERRPDECGPVVAELRAWVIPVGRLNLPQTCPWRR